MGSYLNALSIAATSATYNVRANIAVDVFLLTGVLDFADVEGFDDINICEEGEADCGESQYLLTDAIDEPEACEGLEYEAHNSQIARLDLDGDLKLDFVSRLQCSDDTYHIFLRGVIPQGKNEQGEWIDAQGLVITPDLKRVGDQLADFRPQGQVEKISFEDAKETWYYLYRKASDELLTEYKQRELKINFNEDKLHFAMPLPGKLGLPNLSTYFVGQSDDEEANILVNQNQWREEYFPESLQDYYSDHLRPEEPIQIIAINQKTGYIGTQTFPLKASTWRVDTPVESIKMRPPNLKIHAKRVWQPSAGLSKDEKRKSTIGFEGAATTDDITISITTEWFDEDGSPLPGDLPGYTGRLAKISGDNTLSEVNHFAIQPGIHTEVLKFKGDEYGTNHFYVHVFGVPDYENIGIGAGDGALEHRPALYTPIRVPILDELTTRQLRQQAEYAIEQAELAGESTELLTQPSEIDAVYQWPHRPEMQFSIIDLMIDEINVTALDDQGEVEIVNLLNESYPTISSDTTQIEVIYNLLESQFGPLPLIDEASELVISIAGNEFVTTSGTNQSFTENNLGYLGEANTNLANISPSEFLTISIFQNSDPENVLWEWAFEFIRMVTDMNHDGRIVTYIETASAEPLPSEDPREPQSAAAETSTEPYLDISNHATNPFYFWINDDDDEGEVVVGGKGAPRDIPGKGVADYSNNIVDGMRDLIDFFPLFLDIKAALQVYSYRDYSYRLKI